MKTFISFAAGAAAGAAAAHFLDPQSGRRRRAVARDQAISKAKQGASAAQSQAQHAAGKVQGAAAGATPSSTRLEDADDVTLARKVETEIFRDPAAPKGDVSVDVQAGVAYLRGAVNDASWIERLGEAARQVDGVTSVKNLLHTTGTPAPTAEPRGAITERFGS
jgi:osmotically-inducible protein OsmY